MNQPLEELYLTWLYSLVADPDESSSGRTYWRLLKIMYTTEFIDLIPNDENRAEDGRALRLEFFDDLRLYDVDRDWLELGCSFLEMMIALSRRLAFAQGGDTSTWFWHLVANIGLRYNDRNRFSNIAVEEVLDNVIYRRYHYNGQGGLFPLQDARCDQTRVELWYQMQAYILER